MPGDLRVTTSSTFSGVARIFRRQSNATDWFPWGRSLCLVCRLNRELPGQEGDVNQSYWWFVKRGKRRLVLQLIGLDLLIVPQRKIRRLYWLLISCVRRRTAARTYGHVQGIIPITIEEADDAKREKSRAAFNEPYRTLMGYFRYGIGHYYWDRLICNTDWVEPFRELFGDERAKNSEALKANHEGHVPPEWSQQFISLYASFHP